MAMPASWYDDAIIDPGKTTSVTGGAPMLNHVSGEPTYNDLVDAVNQSNTWSAYQAQRQMDFQKELYEKSLKFNSEQASIDRAFQQDSADRAMQFSSAEAEANRNWQEMMSNTAHQREMADLKAAGLNPILAANNGSAVGAGATATSAQAAGYGASSSVSPSGSRGDTNESATAGIASLLGKMLDNQTEIQKMIVSAETARETAEMYTGATRYAAELNSMASQYMADQSYAASYNNPLNVLGHELADVINSLKNYGISAENGVSFVAGSGLQEFSDYLLNKAKNVASKVNERVNSDGKNYSYVVEKGKGRFGRDIITIK